MPADSEIGKYLLGATSSPRAATATSTFSIEKITDTSSSPTTRTCRPSTSSSTLHPTANIVATPIVGDDYRMEFLDLDTGRPASASIPYSNWPMLTRFDASGERLLTTGGGNVAQLWDWRSGTASGPSSATTIKSWPAGQ